MKIMAREYDKGHGNGSTPATAPATGPTVLVPDNGPGGPKVSR